MIPLVVGSAAIAAAPQAELHGSTKTFIVTSFPYAWFTEPEIPPALAPLVPEGALLDAAGFGSDPTIQGIADLRLQGKLVGSNWRAEIHHEVSFLPATPATGLGGASAGVGLTAPELVDLTWQPDIGDQLTIRGRTDRLFFAFTPSRFVLTVGRQPVSFGSGLVFSVLDVVNPFSPATIDTEYKPGVDAVRADVYAGTASRLTGVVAWAGPLPPYDADAEPVDASDLIFAADGGITVGVTDLQVLVGGVRGDFVVGAGVVSALGPLGVHADASVTVPAPDAVEDGPFVRAVAGGEGRPTSTTTIAVEAYLQTFGAASEDGYLEAAANPRIARGEVWLLGRGYASVSVAQEITPLVSASAAVIANVLDPSALIAPGLSWSVADEAVVGVGGYLAVGARPDPVELILDPTTFAVSPPSDEVLAESVNSEFGLYPHALFLQMKAYF